jgi:PPOX class probable F420-dependent enzyme
MNRAEVERLARGKYLSLTTYKKDGAAIATPVWVARDADELVVITDAGSGKAKRISNSGRVEIAPCDVRGRINGPSVSGHARLTDSSGTTRIENQIKRKYGLQYTAIGLMEKLRRREAGGSVGIRISIDDPASAP